MAFRQINSVLRQFNTALRQVKVVVNSNSSKKPVVESRKSFMFPSLHDRVCNAVRGQVGEVSFHENGQQNDAKETYDTNIIGRFVCNNSSCGNKVWTSKIVGIAIRRFMDERQRMSYNATVFNQRCRACNSLGTFTVDQDSYVERVAYRLRKWAGVPQKPAVYSKFKTPPHKEELCEGCMSDHCQRSWRRNNDRGGV